MRRGGANTSKKVMACRNFLCFVQLKGSVMIRTDGQPTNHFHFILCGLVVITVWAPSAMMALVLRSYSDQAQVRHSLTSVSLEMTYSSSARDALSG